LIVAEIKSKATGDNSANEVFVRYQNYLLKKGLRKSTIEGKVSALKALKRRGAELYDTESVKETIAGADVSEARKELYVYAYENFLEMNEGYWQRPMYKRKRKSVFIPTEEEIDILIHGTGMKTSLLLLLLKETGIRADESTHVHWDDIDFEAGTINITPSKDGNPRKLPLSNTLISRLQYIRGRNQTKDPRRVFAKSTDSRRRVYNVQRKKLAEEYQNTRLNRITFHTFRHWKGTMMVHLGNSLRYVQYVLGHKSLNSTMRYIHLAEAHYNEGAKRYTVKEVREVEEAIPLMEEGYEKADEIDGVHLYRKQLL